jgi:hypothetical protein
MAVNLSPVAGAAAQFFDNSGNVLTGGKLYTYDAGTTTPAPTYTNSSGITPQPNPIILNAAGRVPDSGEIWLADSVSYKFVLKDQNDVLIGTYDNLVGINSNFVNFTGEEEPQTATQGQTIFTLTTINYQPATNNLLVFVNGSKQISGTNYDETSSTVITFVDGLNVGDVVDFCTATPINTTTLSAAQVTYNEGNQYAIDTNVESKLQETVSVFDFMTAAEIAAVRSGVSGLDVTTNFQKALDSLSGIPNNENRTLTVPCGLYSVTQVVLNNCQNVTINMEGAKINAIGVSSYDSVFKIVNTMNTRILGSWDVLGGDRTNYVSLVHCTAEPGGDILPLTGICTTTEIHGLTGYNGNCVLQLGAYNVDSIISEITVYGLNAHLCPTVVHGGGSQTIATFIGCTLTSEANANLALSSYEVSCWLEGGVYKFIGGEILHLLSTAGQTFWVNPCQSATYGSPYPIVSLSGVHLECAAIIAAIVNPRSIATPSSDVSSFSMTDCSGYMNPAIAASYLIDVNDATYVGKIQVKNSNFYSQVVPRTNANIGIASGAATQVDIDSTSFGVGCKNWAGGTVGGILKHNTIPCVFAYNLTSQSIAASSAAVLKWTSQSTTNVPERYSPGYSTSTGVFTVPAFGMTTLKVRASAAFTQAGTGYVEILKNGNRVSIVSLIATDLSFDISYDDVNVAAGTTYSIKLTNTGGATPISFGASISDTFTIDMGTM